VIVFFAVWLGRRSDWAAGRPKTATVWLATAGALAAINFLTSVGPAMDTRNDYWLVVNEELLAQSNSGDVVITECGYICEGYLRYYGGLEIRRPSILPSLESPAQSRLLLSSFALSPPQGLGGQINPKNREEFVKKLEDQYGPLPDVSQIDRQVLWQWTASGWEQITP